MTTAESAFPVGDVVVDVALAPSVLAARAEMPLPSRTVYVVVDVIRATTTLTTQLEYRAERILVAPGIAEARQAGVQLSRAHMSLPPLLAGEAGGLAPTGFDFGNSPAEFAGADFVGRDIIFATTNGTRALHACAGGAAVLAGALRNASAVADAAVSFAVAIAAAAVPDAGALRYTAGDAASEAFSSLRRWTGAAVVVVCAGRGGLPAYDDTLCAGMIAARVQASVHGKGLLPRLGEGARIALATAAQAEQVGILAALKESDAGRAVAEVGLGGDLEWCAALDVTEAVPAVVGTMSGGLLVIRRWEARIK